MARSVTQSIRTAILVLSLLAFVSGWSLSSVTSTSAQPAPICSSWPIEAMTLPMSTRSERPGLAPASPRKRAMAGPTYGASLLSLDHLQEGLHAGGELTDVPG